VPDRNRAGDAAEAVLAQMAGRLKEAGAQVLAMPCNTAHAQAAGVRTAGLPFIDMIAETTEVAMAGGAKKIGILATPGGEALYTRALQGKSRQVIRLMGADRDSFMACVHAVKRGDTGKAPRAEMRRLASMLVSAGAETVIAGCTEVPLLLGQDEVKVPLVDSAEVLAAACVRVCK
jgi:aspartate racemase